MDKPTESPGANSPKKKQPPSEGLSLLLSGYLPKGLNSSKGMIRAHWGVQERYKKEAWARVKAAVGATVNPVQPPVGILWTRYYCGTPMDMANAAASMKYPEDALVRLGVIPDDSPKFLREWVVRQERVPHRRDIALGILIYPLAENLDTRRMDSFGAHVPFQP